MRLVACAILFVCVGAALGQQVTPGSAISVPLTAAQLGDDGAITTEHEVPEPAPASADAAAPVTQIDSAAAMRAVEKMAAAARAIPADALAAAGPPSDVSFTIDPTARGRRYPDSAAVRAMRGPKVAPSAAAKLYSYVYAWCNLAPTDTPRADANDFVAVIDALPTSPTFGKLINVVNTPNNSFTESHHCHVDKDGKWFGAGSLLAFLQNKPDIHMFDCTDPAKPRYSHGMKLSIGACPDEFRALSTGGFAVSSMCARSGGVGGGWAKITGAKMNVMTQYQLPDGLNRSSYDPHGIDVDECNDVVLTSDYFDVSSTVITTMNAPPPKIRTHTTMRVWQYSTGKYLGTIDIANRSMADGMMDTRRLPNVKGQFFVTNGLGMLYHVDAIKMKATLAYCALSGCTPLPGNCISSNIFKSGTRMLSAIFSLSQVRLLDVSNPKAPQTLDILQLPNGAGGHSIKYDETTGMAVLATYFLDIHNKKLGLNTTLSYGSDRKVHLIKVNLNNDRLQYKSAVDFNTALASTKGPSNCHGIAFNTGYSS